MLTIGERVFIPVASQITKRGCYTYLEADE